MHDTGLCCYFGAPTRSGTKEVSKEQLLNWTQFCLFDSIAVLHLGRDLDPLELSFFIGGVGPITHFPGISGLNGDIQRWLLCSPWCSLSKFSGLTQVGIWVLRNQNYLIFHNWNEAANERFSNSVRTTCNLALPPQNSCIFIFFSLSFLRAAVVRVSALTQLQPFKGYVMSRLTLRE